MSDRRVTFTDGRIADDARNKGVSFAGTYAVSYSGLASLDDIPTDAWLAVALAAADPGDPFMSLANATNGAMRRSKAPEMHKKIAFVAVGWKVIRNQFVPSYVVVTNAARANGDWRFFEDGKFKVWEGELEPPEDKELEIGELTVFGSIGARVPRVIYKRVDRLLRSASKKRTGPTTIAQILADGVRDVAKREKTVGNDLLVMIVPRPIDKPYELSITGPPRMPLPKSQMCFYLMAGDDTQLEWTHPANAMNGWAITDFEYKKTGPEEESWQYRIRRRGETGAAGMMVMGDNGAALAIRKTSDGRFETLVKKPGGQFEVVTSKEPSGRNNTPT